MAEEMRETLLSEARPYLLMRLKDEVIKLFTIVSDANRHELPNEFKVTIQNGGKGPAINLSASLWKNTDIFPVATKGYLAVNQEWDATISSLSTDGIALGEEIPWPQLKDKIPRDRTIVVVQYEDIYHNGWLSYLYLEEAGDTDTPYVKDGELNIVELKND